MLASLLFFFLAFEHDGLLDRLSVSSLENEAYTEEEIKEPLEMVPYEHVNIYYSEQEEALLSLTEDTLDYSIEVNKNLLDYHSSEEDSLDLIFFSNREQMESFSNLEDISGFYSDEDQLIGLLPDEKEKLAAEDEFSVFLFQRVLIHEFSHYVLHQKLKELNVDPEVIPLWFHEGVAEWIANYDTKIEPMKISPVPFEKITTDEEWQNSRLNYSTDVYLQSYYMINELVEAYGDEIVLSILKETAENTDFHEAFQKVTNESLTDFEKAFKQEYKGEKTARERNSHDAVFLMQWSLI
jgi:hypothetical protein